MHLIDSLWLLVKMLGLTATVLTLAVVILVLSCFCISLFRDLISPRNP